MGQISPLDLLISNSAFNNCSVTVIYSGVIITDVLLLCDWPVGPLALIVLCRCDRVFRPLFAVVLRIFVVSGLHVCLGGLTLGHESLRLLTDGVVRPRVRDDNLPPPTHRSQCSLSEPDKHPPSNCHASILALKSPDVHTCVNARECACVQHVHVYGICMHMRTCVSQCVFNPAGTW